MTPLKEDVAKKAFDEARARQAEATRLARERARGWSRVLIWIAILFFAAMTAIAMYIGFPTALQMLADYREGWLTTWQFALLFFFLAVGPVLMAVLGLLLVWKRKMFIPGPYRDP